MVTRRTFLNGMAGSAIAVALVTFQHAAANDRSEATASIDKPAADEDVFPGQLRTNLGTAGFKASPLLFTSGRVRAGYQTRRLLFGGLKGPRAILHVIEERPGKGTVRFRYTSPHHQVKYGATREQSIIISVVLCRASPPRLSSRQEVVPLLQKIISEDT